jgi:hypothetical protein
MSHFSRKLPIPLLLGALLGGTSLVHAEEVIIIDDGLGGDPAGGELLIEDESGMGGVDGGIVIDDGTAPGGEETLIVDDGAEGGIMIEDTAVDGVTIDATDGAGDAIVIDGAIDGDLSIDAGSEMPSDELQIEEPAAVAASPAETVDSGRFRIGIDDAHIEYGHFTDGAAASDNSFYGKLSASANWQPSADWEFQLAGRVDGFSEDDVDSFTTVRGDYGDSFVRYRGRTTTFTAGTQTVIWGRMDEVPLSDRVSTADLTRGPLDDLDERRRSAPALRAESYVGNGKLDLVWLYDFRPAELPHKDSAWYPVDTRRGRLPGIDPDDVSPALIRGARVIEDEPSGDGGFGARYTGTFPAADMGVTLARSRQSIPYFRAAGAGVLAAEYPRSWVVGADTAINAAGAIWRAELVYTSDNPVTRQDLSYTTTPGLQWGAGVEFYPGDGDTRVNLQLIGNNLIDAPRVFDRTEQYNFNGELEMPFDRERWRLDVDFLFGLGHSETYLNPELTFLGWEPHEVYVGMHYFAGDDQSLGGFYEDNSVITLGWRASF